MNEHFSLGRLVLQSRPNPRTTLAWSMARGSLADSGEPHTDCHHSHGAPCISSDTSILPSRQKVIAVRKRQFDRKTFGDGT